MTGLNLEHFWGWLSGSLEYFGNQSKHFGNKSKFLAINQSFLALNQRFLQLIKKIFRQRFILFCYQSKAVKTQTISSGLLPIFTIIESITNVQIFSNGSIYVLYLSSVILKYCQNASVLKYCQNTHNPFVLEYCQCVQASCE